MLQRARQENEGKQREQEASVECPTEENPSTADSKSEAEVCCLVPVYRGLRAKKVYVYISKRVLRTFSLSTLGISSLLSCNILRIRVTGAQVHAMLFELYPRKPSSYKKVTDYS